MSIGLGDCGKGTCKKIKAVAKDRKQPRSRTRQHERSRPALKQLATAYLFQQADLVANRRRRHTEFRGGGLEAAVPGYGLESAQGAEGRTVAHIGNLDEFPSSAS
ncbi:hypothetical protein MesoLj113c_34050 [Mesorhizobium sp. 113-3-9]|nr:hypothetical protein MesoLj113c_34050 [Mesorhizobium sp. 113-3-9]